jgi:predicted nucleic acid-binding protein
MAIFVDTGAFLARYIVKDQHHKTAISKWNKLHKSNSKYFTSNFVMDEMITLFGRWVSEEFALEKAYSIYNSDLFTILRPEESDEMHALEYYRKFRDKKIGFTDCVSFALMKKHKIQEVFSFDRHFTDVGFTKI